jgi:dihydrofolate reductase
MKTHQRRKEKFVRTLAVTQNITADGSIEMITDWFDPQGKGDMSDLNAELFKQDERSDALLLGRQTFTDLRGYWRDLEDDTTGISDSLNAQAKYVISSTLTDPEWQNTTVLSGDPLTEVRTLKEQPGRDIVVTGSIRLTHALIEAGLVDEYRLFVYPAIQGRGRRLMPDGITASDLRLLESKSFVSGVVLLRYAHA